MALSYEKKPGKSAAHYTTVNRQTWAMLGMRDASLRVHEDDKDVVSKHAAILRSIRMLHILERKAVTDEQIMIIATRNMPRLPHSNGFDKVGALAHNSVNCEEILSAVRRGKDVAERAADVEKVIKVMREEQGSVPQKMFAKSVALHSLAVAYLEYALALHQQGRTFNVSIFNEK